MAGLYISIGRASGADGSQTRYFPAVLCPEVFHTYRV